MGSVSVRPTACVDAPSRKTPMASASAMPAAVAEVATTAPNPSAAEAAEGVPNPGAPDAAPPALTPGTSEPVTEGAEPSQVLCLISFSCYSLSLMPFVWALCFYFAVVSCWTANVILAGGISVAFLQLLSWLIMIALLIGFFYRYATGP